jgi:hypothetical protein
LILAFGPAATADTVGPLFDIVGRKADAPEFPLEWALKRWTWRSAPRVARTWRCWQRSGARGRGFRRGRRPVRYQTYR